MRRGCQLSGRPRARPASLRCPLLQGPLALFLWGSWGQAPEPAQHKPLPCRWGAETARIPRVPTQKVGLESLTAALRVPGSPRKAGGFHDVGQGHIVGPYVVLPHVQAQDPAEVPAMCAAHTRAQVHLSGLGHGPAANRHRVWGWVPAVCSREATRTGKPGLVLPLL